MERVAIKERGRLTEEIYRGEEGRAEEGEEKEESRNGGGRGRGITLAEQRLAWHAEMVSCRCNARVTCQEQRRMSPTFS